MLLPPELERFTDRTTRCFSPELACAMMRMLESSETIMAMDGERKGVTYTASQLYTVNAIRETTLCGYANIGRTLSDDLCEAIGLAKDEDGNYRKPSMGTLNGFVNHVWPGYCRDFEMEFARAAIKRELAEKGWIVLTIDSTPLEASRYNHHAKFNVHYKVRMDKEHLAMANGVILFGILSDGRAADCVYAGPLCDLLRSAGGLWGSNVKFMMDAGYCTFGCFARAYMVTGCHPMIVLKTNSVIHPEAEFANLQRHYSKLHKKPGFDPYKKNDERYVLAFLYKNGFGKLVGKYLQNCEIRRQEKEGYLVSNDPNGDEGAEDNEGRSDLEHMIADLDLPMPVDIEALLKDVPAERPSEEPVDAAEPLEEDPVTEAPPAEVQEPSIGSSDGAAMPAPVKKDTDRQVCETVHHSAKSWLNFDVKKIWNDTKENVVSFKVSVVQMLTGIFDGYLKNPTF